MNQHGTVALIGGSVIDGSGAPARPNCTVLVSGRQITAVGNDLEIPPGTAIVDVQGKTIIPGLIDFHGHLYARATADMRSQFEAYPKLYLAGGVTTVRSPGDFDPAGTVALRERIARQEEVGPRVFTAGPYFDHAPSSVRWIAGIDSVEAALDQFARWRDSVNEVKVYTRIHEDEFVALAGAAHAAGLPIAAHLGSLTARQAIEHGLNRLEHAIFAIPEFYGGVTVNQDGGSSLTALAALDLDSPLVGDLIQLIVERQVTVCPTTTVFQITHPDFVAATPDFERYYSQAACTHQREMRASHPLLDPALTGTLEQALEKQGGFVKRLHDAGGLVVAGTDPVAPWLTPGYGLHLEIRNMVEAGLTPMAAIKTATLDAARALGRSADLGSVEAGKLADLVVLDGDPLAKITDIGNTAMVFTEGLRHDPRALRRDAEGMLG